MADPNQRSRPGSLDDLLKANKEQFDRVFAGQMRDWGVTRAERPPIGTRERVESVPAAVAEAAPADIKAYLTERFGPDWSSELVDKKVTNGTMTALCRLKVNGTSSMHFGSAPVAGDEAAALEAATDEALRKCAAELIEGADRPTPATPLAVDAPARAEHVQPRKRAGGRLDTITLDLIENALRNARHEMDAVLFRSAMSPVIREQHDEFPMITDARGRMIVGQFGSYVSEMLREQRFELHQGDVILQSDPYKCGGAISHINDWMVLIPIFFEDELVGFSSMFGHMMDVGGSVPGSMPTAATSIFGEGLRIPPVKIYEKGQPNQAVLDVLMNNTRTPEMNHSDLMAIIAGSRAGEKRVMEICARFGKDVYKRACDALLERTEKAMRQLIVQNLPEEPQSFEDYVDDDGLGNGPFKMKLTVWREGEHAYFDWTGTAAQAPGPINFYLHEGMFKMFIGVYMIMVFDPQILFNDGFYDLIHVTMPKGSLLHPEFPAALGCRTHALSRQFDVLGGALSKNAPEMATAAGYGSSPHFLYSGTDAKGRPFQLMEILYGGIPGRPVGDGMDGHSWWPLFENIPTEYLESYYPMLIESYASIADTGGPGKHRGGNGVEKIYLLLEAGEVSIHDDRHASQPWGILGGKSGAVSSKLLIREDGTREALPSKIDNVKVRSGDRIVFRTAGGGGWGDPLEREAKRVRNDVARRLMTPAAAREQYGVVLSGDGFELDQKATGELRDGLRAARGALPVFDFGERPGNGNGAAGHTVTVS